MKTSESITKSVKERLKEAGFVSPWTDEQKEAYKEQYRRSISPMTGTMRFSSEEFESIKF